MTLRDIERLYLETTPDNLAAFLSAIRTARADSSVQTISVISMLDGIIDGFMPEGRMMCDNLELMSDDQKDYLQMHAKIVAAQMILLHETRSYKSLSARILLFLEYSSHILKGGDYDFAVKAVDSMSYPYRSLGFSWGNVEQAPFISTIVHQFFTSSVMDRSQELERFSFAANGQLSVCAGKVSLSSSPLTDSGAVAFSVCDDRFDIVTRNTREQRLKSSDAQMIEKLEVFTRSFISSQNDYKKARGQAQLRQLTLGEKYTVCCTGITEDESQLLCSPVGVRGDFEGVILDEQLLKGLYTHDLIDYILNNDCIRGAKLVEMGDVPVFSIRDSYMDFARSQADADFKANIPFEGIVVSVNQAIDRVIWMTSGGYGAISTGSAQYSVGQIATLEVMNRQGTSSSMFINVRSPRYASGNVRRFDEDEVMSGFVCTVAQANEDLASEVQVPAATAEQISRVKHLARILSHSLCGNSLENYRRLIVSEFLCELISDSRYALYPKSRAAFLANCIALAQKKLLRTWAEDMSPLLEERLILRALSCFFSPEDTKSASALLCDCRPGTKPYFIAQHVLARSLALHIPDEVRTSPEEIREKIAQDLGVHDMFTRTESLHQGKYGMAELDNVEFKSSYVMRNDGKGPDLDRQGRGEVFQAVCGFLNKNGGTVYIGVNNSGDPILGANLGVSGDIRWLSENYLHILEKRTRQLGHPVPKPDTLDHFALFLNDEKELYFKPTLHDYITITPTEDNDAIRITVRPAKYEIAVLYTDKTRTEGCAFVRDGQETIPMSQIRQEQRLMDLRCVSKAVSHSLSLQNAIDRQKKVLLKDYASGSSGEVKDRLVVPINLFYNEEYVWCYDLGAKDFRQFRLSRIGAVETDIPDADYPHTFEPKYADIFRWIGDEDYHVRLRLDMVARNCLVEDYSDVANLPQDQFYEEAENVWILDTHIRSILGLRRFYMGLSDRIEILDTEDSRALKDALSSFCRQNLSDYFKDNN